MRKRPFSVYHPDHGRCKVEAINDTEAIVKAAQTWGQRWQNYNFYAYCIVSKFS